MAIFDYKTHSDSKIPNFFPNFPKIRVGTSFGNGRFPKIRVGTSFSSFFRTSEITKYSFRLENRPESLVKSSECRALPPTHNTNTHTFTCFLWSTCPSRSSDIFIYFPWDPKTKYNCPQNIWADLWLRGWQ